MMKPYQMYIRLITAILLLTLSWCGQAAPCNEQEWNKALVSQQALDSQYNIVATKYNQWLPTFHASVFLHQEFSMQELHYLWNKNVDGFQQKVEQQISVVNKSRHSIDELIEQVTTLSPLARKQMATWKGIQQACKSGNLITNEIATNQYIESNSALRQDINKLFERLQKLESVYNQEITVLQSLSDLQKKSS